MILLQSNIVLKILFIKYKLKIMFFLILLYSGVIYPQDTSDIQITQAIETEFRIDSSIPADLIDIKTVNGIVTLTGEVSNILAKNRAAGITETIRGVLSVINRINVNPGFRPDREIRSSILTALKNDPATELFQARVSVLNGIVSLRGTVDSFAEKELTEEVVSSIKGVKLINNYLKVEYFSNRADIEILQDIKGRLASDVRIDDSKLKVNVENGRVLLSGIVGSAAEKRIAIADSWVTGTKEVEVSQLKVDLEIHNEIKDALSEIIPDKTILEALNRTFTYDPRISSNKIDISVNDGLVILSGVVRNLAVKNAAESDAYNTAGVWRVKNLLKTRPKIAAPDNVIAARFKFALTNDPILSQYDLSGIVINGVIVLEGKVNYEYEKEHATDITFRIKGATDVINSIIFRNTWKFKPDWEIAEDVKEQLYWNPIINSRKILIDVENGTVLLSGEVDTPYERKLAAIEAFQAGAKNVMNKLSARTASADTLETGLKVSQ